MEIRKEVVNMLNQLIGLAVLIGVLVILPLAPRN